MAASNRTQVLRLYRALLRASQRFTAYGYRTYAIRRIRDAFRENKHLKDSEEIQTLVNKARTNLEIIHRQGDKKRPDKANVLGMPKCNSMPELSVPSWGEGTLSKRGYAEYCLSYRRYKCAADVLLEEVFLKEQLH
ncbi:LYR motif-containing protein 4 isoform X1 [Chelonia mydas]|uniref:LYR motif-containing protein 4 isoform X1 n=1 Tax=Chelonia mydas TaxID=8469 RepID=UPI0018A1F06C|nr:LYR motif-containing protein 4 isoform X1 [Chelonia mydas]XP_037749133.1 LYR motif-containing protein 4 isoform X1 [Chelonia mydas]XP_043396104.1 LYR motif-containing protein 4 isoform X1 [Chelonia mydas]